MLVNGGDLIIATAIALLAALVWLANLTLPYAQAVRVRNAFLLRRGHPEDFSWTPATVPDDFRSEELCSRQVEQAPRLNSSWKDLSCNRL